MNYMNLKVLPTVSVTFTANNYDDREKYIFENIA